MEVCIWSSCHVGREVSFSASNRNKTPTPLLERPPTPKRNRCTLFSIAPYKYETPFSLSLILRRFPNSQKPFVDDRTKPPKTITQEAATMAPPSPSAPDQSQPSSSSDPYVFVAICYCSRSSY